MAPEEVSGNNSLDKIILKFLKQEKKNLRRGNMENIFALELEDLAKVFKFHYLIKQREV